MGWGKMLKRLALFKGTLKCYSMENGNRRKVSGYLMGKNYKNCCILMGKRIFAEAAPVSRHAVMLVTASFIAACKYLHRGLLMYVLNRALLTRPVLTPSKNLPDTLLTHPLDTYQVLTQILGPKKMSSSQTPSRYLSKNHQKNFQNPFRHRHPVDT